MGKVKSIFKYVVDTQKLHIIRNSVSIPPKTTEYYNLPIPSNYKKYDLRALYAKNMTNYDLIAIKIGETDKEQDIRYVSLSEPFINDILTFPFEDKEDTGCIHMWISNSSSEQIVVSYELRIYDLK